MAALSFVERTFAGRDVVEHSSGRETVGRSKCRSFATADGRSLLQKFCCPALATFCY